MNVNEQGWKNIYRWGGFAAFLSLGGTLIDITLSMIPGWEPSTVPDNVQGWFTQLQSNPYLGFRNLDFLNLIISIISIFLLLALFGALYRKNLTNATLALVLGLIGVTLFIANNAALPMFELSLKYAVATTDTQRIVLEAAGESLLSRGEHGSMGIFIAFFFSSLGTFLMSIAMLNGKVFKKSTGWVGIIGMVFLIAYVIGSTFIPNNGDSIIAIIAMPGGLLMIYWYVIVGRRLLNLHAEQKVAPAFLDDFETQK